MQVSGGTTGDGGETLESIRLEKMTVHARTMALPPWPINHY
ncbi:MAG: hypothetical protein AAGJ55_07560 [Cyanobacteria bacterium J06555_12]